MNADQIVVNRAFLFNSTAVYRDYLSTRQDDEAAPDREAVKNLLQAGVIVPYLLYEDTPVQDPGVFGLVEEGNEGWLSICREVRPRCIRLDWDDDNRNAEEINKWLTSRFRDYSGRLA